MKDEKESILHLLNPEREKRRSVVSIVGMGGLGKTTLAKRVFKDPWIQSRFHCAVWIDVSKDYQEVKLLKDLLRQICPDESKKYEKMEKTMLESCVHKSLLGKTYLIVMDDVWDSEVWRMFGMHLPDEGNGSKVLITTRNREVADAADPDLATRAYELRFLNQKESRDLFLSKAIPIQNERSDCTGRLKKLGEQMADKCGGLPLALVVMGGLLSQKQRSISEWERVSRSMVWQDEGEGQNFMKILRLSYLDLPYDLKWCFLYLGAFPEAYQIESDRLIRLWIAEGFIAERGDTQTLEETAEIQLEKLIERSLVHVVERDHYNGIILCRVHELLRDLCISEAKQIDFMSLHLGTRPLPAELSHRRLSVITEPEEIISRLKSTPRLRALLGFNFHETAAMNLFVGGLKLIRVIDLEGATNLKVLPNEIGGLVNLRYLGLRGTSIEWLPKTIKNLSRLQFLDVRETPIKEMTSAVWNIETLRQVFFPTNASIPYMGHCWWRSLQVLSFAATDRMHDSLPWMKDIKTLEIWQIDAPHHKRLSLKLSQFWRLKILKLQGSSIPWTALTRSRFPQLRTLVLWGQIKSEFPKEVRPESEKLELDYSWPVHLTYLELRDSHLHRDPLRSLDQLYELRFLTLWGNVYSWGKEMKFRGVEFRRLQKLVLCGLQQVERIVVEYGAMPRLQELQLSSLQQVRRIVVECGALPRLQELELRSLDQLETMTFEYGVMPCLRNLRICDCPKLETIPGSEDPETICRW